MTENITTPDELEVLANLQSKLNKNTAEAIVVDKDIVKTKLAPAMELMLSTMEVENPNKATTAIKLSNLKLMKQSAVDYLSLNLDETLPAIDGKSVEQPLRELFEAYISNLPDAPVEEI